MRKRALATGAVGDILKAGGHKAILLTIQPGYVVSRMVDEWLQQYEEIKTGQQKPADQS